jgi:threonine synthase
MAETSAAGAIQVALRCAGCGAEGDPAGPSRCRKCGGLWDLGTAAAGKAWGGLRGAPSAGELAGIFAARRAGRAALDRSGVWRFRELLAWAPDEGSAVTLEEGHTPCLEVDVLGAYAGLDATAGRLWIKHEGMNPTGSFKDRGMTAAVSCARAVGARAIACASTGNTSASLAAYGARAGLASLVLLPAGKVAPGKLAQTLAYGARLVEVEGSFDDCLRLLDEGADALGLYVANSVNPFRLEGQKTIVFELLEDLGWEAPDWIALPAGNLGNTSAFGQALVEAHAAGLIDRLPRLLAVQAAGAAPFARSHARGFTALDPIPDGELDTVATAIRIGNPASFARGVAAIRATEGEVLAVDDAEILAAKAAIDRAGVGCEPASAASLAGVRRARAAGAIAASDSVVCVLTGHLLKHPAGMADAASRSPIPPDVAALERVISGLR